MEYKTQDAEPTTLYKLVRSEPDWAASRIREGEKAQQEIESLRSTVDQLTRTLAACCIARDLTADDGDEWKRRADEMHYWMQTGTCRHKYHENFWAEFVHNCEEAAEWFEEKDDE